MRRVSRKICWLGVAAGFAVLMLLAAGEPARASETCGDGIVDQNEECDGGGGLFIDGDPDGTPCVNGSRCYFQFTCCKFNCQYVGTPGVPCFDGNNCTGPDTCDQIGVCQGGPNAANNTPCDDGLFCTGVEACQNGVCLSSTGNPCPGTACNMCQEDTDSCLSPVGVPCSDGSACVDGGNCDGAGNCTGGTFNSGPCDDGIFCNGTDTCGGGACSVHSGDPCVGADGDTDCQESCDELADTCTANDPVGAPCNDETFCNGAGDTCLNGSCLGTGTAACDDNNSCTTDDCDEGLDSCAHDSLADGSICDDGDRCTINDFCEAGVCSGPSTLLDDLCPWTLVMREQPKGDLIRTNFLATFDGDVCGGSIRFGDQTQVVSDLVSGDQSEEGAIRLCPTCLIGEDIVSAGAGAKTFPASDDLPYVLPASRALAPGSLTPKSDATGFYNLTGAHDLAGDCIVARNGFPASTSALEALPATDSIPPVRVKLGQSLTITATNVGGLNVIDVDGVMKVGKDGVVELNGGGDPNTVMVLRVAGKLQMLLRSELALRGGLTPSRTMIYARGKICLIADLAIGGGTVLCSPGRVRIGRAVAWAGSIFGDGRLMKIGERSFIQYTPFQGF